MWNKLIFLTSVVLVLALAGTNVVFGASIDIRIAAALDDHEEWINDGKMDKGSTDLEIPYENQGTPATNEQLVGLRFANVSIPKGALISNAYVELEVDSVSKAGSQAPVNLVIEGELTQNAAQFADTALNISQRLPNTTIAKVKWSAPPATAVNQKIQTVDISSIIQEIINQEGWASGNALVLIFRDDKENPSTGLREVESFEGEPAAAALLHIEFEEGPATIIVDPNSDIAAANALAKPGDTIQFAAGTFMLAEQIAIKDGVTYRGAGPGLTIIDGNDATRAFVAWGDRGATNGQVDANGAGIQNTTGPKGWVLEGMTIRNCVADTKDRQDILSAARDLLTNYKAVPYTLAAAQTENGGVASNPEWFDILSGGADDNLTDVELQAYLDANPVGSAGHIVANDDQTGDGGAITIDNAATGTIQNCEFLNNHTPAEGAGDDGGALNITGLSVITINDCLFDGNYAVSPDSVALSDFSGLGGHIILQGSSASAITPGTTLIANRCIFLNGNAEDDAGAIRTSAIGSILRLDSCWFEGNAAADDGTVLFIGNESSGELTVTNCVFANNISTAASDRMCQVRRDSRFINCTFVGNNQNDEDLIYNNADVADTDGDGVDDETTDTTQVINCIFVNNIIGDGDHVLGSRNANFSIAATNCLFFGNTRQNGSAGPNCQRTETGSVNADPLLDAAHVPGAGSPAIDAGVDPATVGVVVTTDYSGNARPQGAGYDIGAYEFVVAPPPAN